MENVPFHYRPEDFPDPHREELDYNLLDLLQELTPAERLERLDRFNAFLREVRAAGERYYESISRSAQTPER